MADSYTANYNFTKPEVSASRDTWGNKQNENLDNLDTILKNLSDSKLTRVNATQAGFLSTTALPTGDKARPFMRIGSGETAEDVRLATFAQLDEMLKARLPAGAITMWWGSVANIPAGWVLCNGQNGTPNLLDRFIVGAGGSYNVATTGGATSHDHGGQTAGHALTTGQMPVHAHGVSDPGHSHGVNDPGHAHAYVDNGIQQGGNIAVGGNGVSTVDRNRGTAGSGTGISIAANGSNIAIQNNGGGQAHAHGIGAADSRPPFFALCFIMKT